MIIRLICRHAWHPYEYVNEFYPPIIKERCIRCGAIRLEQKRDDFGEDRFKA